jgi:LacI family transcriptional regulator
VTTSSVKDVARLAGVSLGTVSNVLNRPELVRPGTRQRVLDAIEQLGFVRNEGARALRAGRSRTIGFVVLDMSNPFFTDVASGAEECAEESGRMLLVCNSAEASARERRHLALLEEQRVQGILITPVGQNDGVIDELIKRGTSIVLVDRKSGQANRCSVAVDDHVGGRLATDHLLAQGHRRIAFVGGPFSIQQVTDRHYGAATAMAEAGLGASLRVVETSSLSIDQGKVAAQQLLALPARSRPTAAFCANDLLALGFLQEMTRTAFRVPEDMALIGYDDIVYAAEAAVPLSSVRQPRELLGRTGAELLIEEISDAKAHRHRHVVFQPELVVRKSTDWKLVKNATSRRARATAP